MSESRASHDGRARGTRRLPCSPAEGSTAPANGSRTVVSRTGDRPDIRGRRFPVSRATRLLWAATLAGALLLPATAAASSGAHTFLLMADAANVGVAANGDRVHVTCEGGGGECGWFSIHPKAIHASGEFAHFKANGSLFATGT